MGKVESVSPARGRNEFGLPRGSGLGAAHRRWGIPGTSPVPRRHKTRLGRSRELIAGGALGSRFGKRRTPSDLFSPPTSPLPAHPDSSAQLPPGNWTSRFPPSFPSEPFIGFPTSTSWGSIAPYPGAEEMSSKFSSKANLFVSRDSDPSLPRSVPQCRASCGRAGENRVRIPPRTGPGSRSP